MTACMEYSTVPHSTCTAWLLVPLCHARADMHVESVDKQDPSRQTFQTKDNQHKLSNCKSVTVSLLEDRSHVTGQTTLTANPRRVPVPGPMFLFLFCFCFFKRLTDLSTALSFSRPLLSTFSMVDHSILSPSKSGAR